MQVSCENQGCTHVLNFTVNINNRLNQITYPSHNTIWNKQITEAARYRTTGV